MEVEEQVEQALDGSDAELLRQVCDSESLLVLLAKRDSPRAKDLMAQVLARLHLVSRDVTTGFAVPTAQESALIDDERVEVMRSVIRHENDLVNHRITWLTLFNGFAMSYLSGSPASDPQSQWWREVVCEAIAIPICISAGFALALAGVAVRRQLVAFKRFFPGAAFDAPGVGILGARLNHGSSLLPRLIIPAFVFGIWLLRLLTTTTTLQIAHGTLLAVAGGVGAFFFWRSWEIWMGGKV